MTTYFRGVDNFDTANPISIPAASITLAKLSATGTQSASTFLSGANVWTTIGPAQLQATGTASSTTYLRGDGVWSAISTPTSLSTGSYTISESGGALYFKFGGTNIAKLDSSGNLTVLGNVTAFGTVA